MRRQLLAYGELLCFLAAWTAGLLATVGSNDSAAPEDARSAAVSPAAVSPADPAGEISYE
ncbi:hypothetical protein [Adhaeretor mobilis]|nr:hypothetical protein [Adhaeretor mobilis]